MDEQLVEEFVTTNSKQFEHVSLDLPEGGKRLKLEVYQDWTGATKGNHACIWGEPTFILANIEVSKTTPKQMREAEQPNGTNAVFGEWNLVKAGLGGSMTMDAKMWGISRTIDIYPDGRLTVSAK